MQQNMRPITKPDLNTIFESMLAIPANVRAQHVNAYLLTGTPEQKLAAAMIKDMPQSQAPSAPVQAPTQTVIDQKLAQVEPGIAALPVAEGMFEGGSYAGGGIIAFDEGGDVPSYAGNSGYGSLINAATITPFGAAKSAYENVKGIAGGEAAQQIGGVVRMAWESEKDWLKRAANIIGIPVDTLLKEKQAAPEAAKLAPNKPLAAMPATPTDKVQQAADMAAPVNKSQSFSSGLGNLDWTNITDNSSAYDKLRQAEKTPQALMEERAGLIGIDPNRAANDAKLKAMEAKTSKAEEDAPWMALAQFGLGLVGARKGQVGETIAKSGISALQGLSAAKEKVDAAREKQFDLATRQAQADRAEKVAGADYGLNSAEHIKAQNRAAELAKLGYKNELDVKNTTGQFEAKKAKVAAELDMKKLQQSAAQHAQTIQMYKERMKSQDAATRAKSMQVLSTLSANIDKSPDYQAQLAALQKEFKDKGGASSPGYQKRAADLKTIFMGNMLNSLSGEEGSIPSSTDLLAD